MAEISPGHSIRPAGAADIAPLTELAVATYIAAFGSGFEPLDLAAHLEHRLSRERIAQYLEDDNILIAEHDATLVGFAQFGEMESPACLELRRLYVTASWQNRGLGGRLMLAVLADPRMQVAERIQLDVWEENSRARQFYERFGFREIGRRPFVVASGKVTGYDLIMAKTLRGAA
jgi:ribosomal protein S18 acetylase RimI-like enzyme